MNIIPKSGGKAGKSGFYRELDLLLAKKSEKLLTLFIQKGPEALRRNLNIKVEKHWNYIFEQLVCNQDVLKKCVLNFMPFFKNLIAENGPLILRKVFQIEESKYDQVFERLLDLVAVSTGSLFDYVYENRKIFVLKIVHGQSKNLRNELGIKANKYDHLWMDILEMLQEALCNKVYQDQALDRGLMAFNKIINVAREHRSLRSFKAMWSFSRI